MTPTDGGVRTPPNDQDAEQSVICAMLFDREALVQAAEILTAADFYRPDFEKIFDTMMDLNSHGIPVDIVTVCDKLHEKSWLDEVGGRERIYQIAQGFITSANIAAHARIVAEKSLLRRLIKSAQQILSNAYGAAEETPVILEAALKSIFDIAQGRTAQGYTHIKDILALVMDRIQYLYENQGKTTGVPTGFADFDKKTQGLQPSDLILIGARPSMGKTAFLLNIASHAALEAGVPTVVFSLEMSREQLGNRLLSAQAHMDSLKLRTGNLGGSDWDDIYSAMDPLSKAPLYIDDSQGITIPQMRAKCRRLKAEKNLGLVVVDYLQLMSAPQWQRTESRQMEISEISRGLKGLAKELNVPMLVAAQLSRAVEARSKHRPMLSDLRESGAIEQDADVVAFLYRDVYYNPQALNPFAAEVIIAKQRNGPTGTIEMQFDPALTRFRDATRDV